jgi:hypothetical protein
LTPMRWKDGEAAVETVLAAARGSFFGVQGPVTLVRP